ncbi:MAG: HD domain-containing protein [Candidatus Woesearchaeota archaeon]|jgi:hypothetical protein
MKIPCYPSISNAEPLPTPHSTLNHVPRVNAFIMNNGLLEIPQSLIQIQSSLGIPNIFGESMLGHCETVMEMTKELLDGLETIFKIQSSTKHNILIAAYLHDIGKSGPSPQINQNPEAFIKFYNVNFLTGTQKTNFISALNEAVAIREITYDEKQYIINTLKVFGVDPERMTLRDFYNLHSLFTHDILKEAGVEEFIARTASAHHLKRGVKPNGYTVEELAENSGWIALPDEFVAMARLNNPNNGLSTNDRIRAVYESFQSAEPCIRDPYYRILEMGMSTGVLPVVLENHERQR